jgi:uncharacterized protein YodC (DUF2158 family)
MNEYNIGDVVQLKSGGAPMTVRDTGIGGDGSQCQNMTNLGNLQTYIFPEVMLMPCNRICLPDETGEEEAHG